jgi:outer membrane receptor protein involved in Fe transport
MVVEAAAAYSGQPLASFEVQARGTALAETNGADGRSELSRLAPGRYAVTVRAAGFLPERASVDVLAGTTATLSVMLVEAVAQLDELIVTASRYDVADGVQPSATYFSRDEVENLPLLGDDTLRVTQRLPGVTGNGLSARPLMRGGAADEVAVLLDGVRLAEPYHLRDFQSVFSSVDQRIVDRVVVHAGGFPAEYGDALSGLVVVEPREPAALAHELGLSVLYTSLLSSGTFADGRASWLVSGRDSNLDRVLADELGEPAYWDVFVRVGVDLGAKHRLVLGGLGFRDDVRLTGDDGADDRERATSDIDSRQAWLKVDSDWTDRLSSTTWLYSTSVTSRRQADVADLDELVGTVDDRRALDALAVRQRWQYAPTDRQLLRFGFETERREADYSYASAADRRGLLATVGGPASLSRNHALAADSDSYALHVEDRVRLNDRFIADLGLRWDRQTHLPAATDDRFSPRLSLLVRLDGRTDVRISHGRFFQAESLLDLPIEDGVTEFRPAQRAVHSIVSVERRLAGSIALRGEWYRKRTRQVRPRFENLYDPLVVAPELRSSRVLVAPERAEADGLELTVSGESPVSWWFGLSLANADDRVAGAAVPRSWDQDRGANAGVTWAAGRWIVSAAATVHRGWPLTELAVTTTAAGERVAVAGPRNAARNPSVRRLDVRLTRDFALGDTSLRFSAEIQNLTDRVNACCLAYEPAVLPDGSPTLLREARGQGGITGNVGLLWQF